MFCVKCGSCIADDSRFCNKCGQPVVAPNNWAPAQYNNCGYPTNQKTQATQTPPYNIVSVIGFVISLISLLLNFYGIVGMGGTVVSIVGMTKSKEKNEKGYILAIVGFVIGLISIVYGAITLITLMQVR